MSGGTVFSRLGETVVRRHRLIVLFWVIALVAAIPVALNEGSALSLQQGSASGSHLESVEASDLISTQFAKSVAPNTLVIVVTAKNVTTPAVQDYIRTLVAQIQADKNLTGVQNVTSVYSVLYPILNGTGGLAHKALTQAQLESLAGGVAWKPARYSLGPAIGSLVSSFVSPNANTTLIAVDEAQSSTSNVFAIRSIVARTMTANGGGPVSSVQVTGGDA